MELLKEWFKKFDKNKDKLIDWEEFKEMMKAFTLKDELREIFLKYSEKSSNFLDNDMPLMKIEQFHSFLKLEQEEKFLLEESIEIIKSFKNQHNSNDFTLSFHDFCLYMFSIDFNNLFDHEKRVIYQVKNSFITTFYFF